MTRLRKWPVGLLAATAACLLLAALLLLEWLYGGVVVAQGPWTPAKLAEAKLLPLPAAGGALAGEGETTNRPLFITTRRPPPAAPVTPTPRIVRDQFQLQGTIVVGGLDIAMLRERQTGKVIRVEKGATVSDMTLAEVYPDRVVLKSGEETETLNLAVATGPTAPPATPTAAPVGPGGRPAGAPQPAPGPTAPTAAGGEGFGPRPPRTNANPAVPPSPPDANVGATKGAPEGAADQARRRARQGAATW